MGRFKATFRGDDRFKATFLGDDSGPFQAHFGQIQYVQVGDWYEGDYTAEPTEEAQTIPTNGKVMAQDFVVGPIPTNYGKITCEGNIITVS